MTATTIRVSADVPAPAESVFRRLSDLDAHRHLASPGIEVLSLDGRRGARTGGLVRLNGPLGLRVMARTASATRSSRACSAARRRPRTAPSRASPGISSRTGRRRTSPSS
ncbi:MAG TPA: hypothetical protein VF549_06390 [Solirubrobacteraceae bacterium]|jgi:hypothetical protein